METSLFDYCRYYKGEKTCPFDDTRASLWDYERAWCEMQAKKDATINEMVRDYNLYGLSDFEPYDDVPLPLKAFLFNRYSSWNGTDIAAFKEWYNEIYKKTGL